MSAKPARSRGRALHAERGPAFRSAWIAAFALTFPSCTCRGGHRGTDSPQTPDADMAVTDASGQEPDAPPWDPDRIGGGDASYPLRRFTYALEDIALGIEDAGMRPSLRPALERTHALLAINGGFFDPGGAPIGLAISNGRELAPFAPSLSGGVLEVHSGHARLVETESFAAPSRAGFAIQCRPRLVVAGRANVRSDDGKHAARTAICLRQAGTVLDVIIVRGDAVREPAAGAFSLAAASGPSLFALAHHLVRLGCEDALNLDGGPSTGAAFWQDGKIRQLDPIGPIRHAIVVKAASREEHP